MTRGISFHSEDDCGLFTEEEKIPYVSIKLTKEQAELIEGKLPRIYETDGYKIFDIRSPQGGSTGEKFIYVMFI